MVTKALNVSGLVVDERPIERAWWGYLLWILVAAVLGFGIGAVFAGVLHLPRNIYLIPYVAMVGLLLYAFVRWSGLSVMELLRKHWVWGVVGGIPLAAFTVNNIVSQPASARSQGVGLVGEILWVGILYGLADALLLSALPVLATWKAFGALGWTVRWWGKIPVGIIAIVMSLAVTVAYHLGYPECRVAGGLFGPVLGNTAMSLGYVVTGNPFAAMLSHVAMHVAGVLQGPASVIQLPPHY